MPVGTGKWHFLLQRHCMSLWKWSWAEGGGLIEKGDKDRSPAFVCNKFHNGKYHKCPFGLILKEGYSRSVPSSLGPISEVVSILALIMLSSNCAYASNTWKKRQINKQPPVQSVHLQLYVWNSVKLISRQVKKRARLMFLPEYVVLTGLCHTNKDTRILHFLSLSFIRVEWLCCWHVSLEYDKVNKIVVDSASKEEDCCWIFISWRMFQQIHIYLPKVSHCHNSLNGFFINISCLKHRRTTKLF